MFGGAVGLDLSRHGVGVVADGAQFLPVKDATDVGAEHAAVLAEAMRRRARRRKGRRPWCGLSIPLDCVRVGVAKLPRLRRSELRKVMAQDAFWRETLGMESGEFHRWWSLAVGDEGCRVRMVALARADAEAYMDCARRGGLRPRVLVVVLPGWDERPDDSVLLWLDAASPCAVSNGAAHPAVRRLPAGEWRVGADVSDVRIVCADKSDAQVRELQRSLQAAAKVPVKVSAHTPFEWLRLPEKNALPAEAQFPLARASIARKTQTLFQSRNSAVFAEFECADTGAPLRVACACTAAALPAVVGLSHGALHEYVAGLEGVPQTRAMLEDGSAEVGAALATLNKDESRRADDAAQLEHFVDHRRRGTEFLNTLRTVLPPGIRLQRFEFQSVAVDDEPLMRLTGFAPRIAVAEELIERLRAVPGVDDVRMHGLSRAKEGKDADGDAESGKFEFVIECYALITENGGQK